MVTMMPTRRNFIKTLPAAAAPFAVTGAMLTESGSAHAQDAPSPLEGHFHPKGKAPSKFTKEVLDREAE